MLQGSDGEHFMSMDKDDKDLDGLLLWVQETSGRCGSNKISESDTVMINAKNGNIDIIATNGNKITK